MERLSNLYQDDGATVFIEKNNVATEQTSTSLQSSSLPTVHILPSVRTHTHELKMISREQSHLNHSHL
jgi:hypothetical protein